MFEDRSRLLRHLVTAHFGAPVGEVAGLLLARGTLPFSHLTRLSSLPPSLIQQSLLVLSLHSLLYHSESEISGRLVELYELNSDAVECRLRGGLYVNLANEIAQSPDGRMEGLDKVIETLWMQGMCDQKTLLEKVRSVWWSDQNEGEGKGKGKAKELNNSVDKKIITLLSRALRDGFISIVTPGSQLSPQSLEIKWEEELKLSIKGVPTTKDLKEVKEKLREKKIQWRDEERERARGKIAGAEQVKKRKLGPDEVEYLVPLPKGAFYRINTERFHIRWRSQLVLDYCRTIYNPAVASILELILDLVENDIDSIDEAHSRAFTINELLSTLSSHPSPPNLTPCFAPKTPDTSFRPPKRTHDLVTEICRVLQCADDASAYDSPKAFLSPAGGRDGNTSRWTVNFAGIGRGMRRAVVEGCVKEKVGSTGLLMWRIMESKGKLEEKHLARLAFLPIKDARLDLSRLHQAHLIEQQDIPRSADRAPSRTLFLWHVDFSAVTASLLSHHDKALANLQAQRTLQLEKRKGLIGKRERSDVRLEMDKYLSRADLEAWSVLEGVLEALATAEGRLDRDRFVLGWDM